MAMLFESLHLGVGFSSISFSHYAGQVELECQLENTTLDRNEVKESGSKHLIPKVMILHYMYQCTTKVSNF